MRRSPWFRALASLLALWFPLMAGEPGVLDPCPMHGAGAAIAAAFHRTSPAAMHHGHMHHAAARTAHATHGNAPRHDHHNCTCISCCVVSGAALRAPDAPTAQPAAVTFVAVSAVSNVASLARPAPEYSHPYTTGPPRV
jgi:hypothetical protein